MNNFDVVIVGGGMVGQAFALSMSQKTNATIAIIEPNNPNPKLNKDFHTRVSAITPTSELFLKSIGVWDLVKRKHAFTQTKVWDQNSHGNLDFNATDDDLTHLGHIVENDVIQSAMFIALDDAKVTFISAKLDDIEKTEKGYQLKLDDDQSLSCDLLIGADGARSRIRDLAHIEFSETNYQQKAIVCNIRSDQSFEDTTWQRFLSDSIIALLPLSDHEASIVWSAENHLADELVALSTQDFADRLSAGVEYRFGQFEVLNEVQAFPLIERSAKDYVKEGVALIGDAAHNIHPLAGQGVNLGFADVEELSNQLRDSTKSLGDYGVLRTYARARRLDNELMAKTMTGLNWIYKENNEPLRWLRGFGMNLVNENPTLKSFFQAHATGKL
ncbi:MAG: 2-octaprenyl-3-methyl-6-methoxy-1,4-benzoquinol hydroxylase [Candidatus Ruthia sp.]|jgi:2-octaprenyl-3-methyl-6-methoxy-1,4-benzoquinol hydroxylase/2-octaprenylphenol hydroxylase|nr:2-octaprenyl-3-methyl-6-methoxy-1,4-benzoquinol hydroxylase [Candidatus Ruthturnera sp.]MBT4122919.1 2-octaprenyl-3-methyl-6-methoxy-1,4-benzoquinol hydroxylase [Candidatus Ruthturnera sp.]MBT4668246.1 2-octaprenyl-3-methyl-6-methoxy-1,4-benzoquinol hydroxylase [Candidatus Ruthturnera sp.]MBT6922398.1 2-octaprenyl-3-methyl-6-methoxy-1,4-benzoquinol hydroxylase [Candidatus Ruthturnera sp.]